MGHILMTNGFPQHAFFFGANSGKNGKSTFFQMLSNFAVNCFSSLALEELEQKRLHLNSKEAHILLKNYNKYKSRIDVLKLKIEHLDK